MLHLLLLFAFPFHCTAESSSSVLYNTKYALIYNDTGVATSCFEDTALFFQQHNYTVVPVDSKVLIQEAWITAYSQAVLAFPGGADTPYHSKLRGAGCHNIRTFVSQGGHYVGICAGSYFGSKKIEYDVGGSDEIIAYRELGFFPGVASGPVLNHYDYSSESGASAATIQLQNGSKVYVYHNGGPTFLPLDEDLSHIEILGTYVDSDYRPAIIKCPYGDGFALLSGVHFERSLERMSDEISTSVKETLDTLMRFLDSLF